MSLGKHITTDRQYHYWTGKTSQCRAKLLPHCCFCSLVLLCHLLFLFSLDQRRPRSSSVEHCGRPVDSQPPCLLSSSSSSSRPPSAASTTASHHLSASPRSGPFGGEQTVILYALITGCSLGKLISPPKHWLS